MPMSPRLKQQFDAIVQNFESFYVDKLKKDQLSDTHATRTAFYASCLLIVREGPPLKSLIVQRELLNYYTKLTNEEYEKAIEQADKEDQ